MRDESGKVKIFLSYAPEDEKMRDVLDKRLGSLNAQDQVTIWHDGKILPGADRAEAIKLNLETSDIILLLVSPDFVSKERYAEIQLAMENHRTRKSIVIPILLRPGVYDGMPFEQLTSLPRNQIPISLWAKRDKAYQDVLKGIQAAIKPTKAQLPLPALKQDRVGQQFGKYRLVELLGQGGFARVYLGKHISLDSHAAIKILKTQVADEDKAAFIKEARTIASLEHPHIVHVWDCDLEENIPYLVMEYASNGTLRQRHPKNSRLLLPDIISYARQVADALQYAHTKGLIHRDIKPENLLLGADDKVLLSDFGIAIVAHNTSSLKTELENIVGTATYMAPEQFRGKPRYTSDQYALAVIVYEWLCGTPPFKGDALQLGYLHTHEPPPRMENVSPVVEQTVLKALAKDPEQRYPKVTDFVTALEEAVKAENEVVLPKDANTTEVALLEEEAVEPKELASLGEATKPKEEVSLGDAVESQEVASPQEATEPEEVVSQEEATEPEDAAVASEQAKADTSQDVKNNGKINESAGLHIPDANDENPITDILSEQSAPQKSDILQVTGLPPVIDKGQKPRKKHSITRREVIIGIGSLSAITAVGGSIKLISSLIVHPNTPVTPTATTRSTPPGTASITTSTSPTSVPISDTRMCNTKPFPANPITAPTKIYPTITYRHHSGEVDTVAWSPDGSRIASGSRDGTVQVWNPDTGNLMHTFKLNFQNVFAVAWSPIRNYLAWGGDDTIVHVQQMGNVSAADFQLPGHAGAIHGLAWSPNGEYIASASDDKTVNIWRWDASGGRGTFVATYSGHSDAVHAVAWSPDGKFIASSSVDRSVQVWDASTWKLIRKFIGHNTEVDTVTWSPDSKYVASGSLDNTMRVWDTTAACQFPAYSGSSGKVLSVAWSLKEQLIAAGSDDWQVRVWNPASTTAPFYTYTGHTNWVHAVSWAPDGSRRIASASADTTVQIWQP